MIHSRNSAKFSRGRRILIPATAALFFASPVLFAQTFEVTLCDNCTDSQYGQAAVEAGCPQEHDVYVANRPDFIIRAYETICSYDPDLVIEKAVHIDGDPAIIHKLNVALDFYHWLSGTKSTPVGTLPGVDDNIDSAVDLAGPNRGYFRGLVADGIERYARNQLSEPLPEYSDPIFDFLSNNFSTFIVQFPDGSTYEFEFDDVTFAVDGTLIIRYKAVPGSGIDGSGERIPEDAAGLAGRTPITGPSTENYIDFARRLQFILHCINRTTVSLDGCEFVGDTFECHYSLNRPC